MKTNKNLTFGSLARFFNRYSHEVEFAKENGFEFMQLWYDKNGLSLHKEDKDFITTIKNHHFPTIIHAVLNINEIVVHLPNLTKILKQLDHKELIIHPICENKPIDEYTLFELDKVIKYAIEFLKKDGVTLYLENNSKLDPMFTESKEIQTIFANNEDLHFLLDIAHIDNLNHLREMVSIKMPDMLHIADRRYHVVHEHIPLGQGDIEYETIFTQILHDFKGKIIFEILTDSDIIDARNLIKKYLCKNA